jgi:sugar lactone lactonase YvrE
MKKYFNSRRGAITIIVFLGLLVRIWAAFQLPIDYDEPVYLGVANDYAHILKNGNLSAILDYLDSREHPPLTKLLYGLAVWRIGDRPGFSDALLTSRMISVIFGTLAVWLMAVLDPVAGFLLAIQTYAVKYTSQAYLEAIPLFASLAALFFLLFSRARRDRWFWLSACALGLTAAGKYSYFPILVVILYVYFFEKKYRWQDLFLYLGVAVLTFLILDPAIWRNPPLYLYQSLAFHPQYAQGEHVAAVGYPWYQPLRWLSKSFPYEWHPNIFFYNPLEGLFSVDGIIFVLSLFGIYYQWRERRWVVVWILSGVIFLLIWPTKWPQYTLVVIPAFCLAASAALARIWRWVKSMEDNYGWFSTMIPAPTRIFWFVLSFLLIIGVVFTTMNAISLSTARRGWSHLTKSLTPLPSNQVNAMIHSSDGRMVLGTEAGLVFWQAAGSTDVQDQWLTLTTNNSGLPNNRVTALAEDDAGNLWVGTRAGLGRYDGDSWQVYRAADMGLSGDEIHDIQRDGSGRIWVASNGGIAMFDGSGWRSYTRMNSGLPADFVLSLATDSKQPGEVVYLGTDNGLAQFTPENSEWLQISPERFNARNGGISDLLVDSQGRLWVATLGNGLSVRENGSWKDYRLSNSGLPSNRVDLIAEGREGEYWVGASFPERPGGQLAQLRQGQWKTYRSIYSGYSGASSVTMAVDSLGRLWFGTQTGGVDIYKPPE